MIVSMNVDRTASGDYGYDSECTVFSSIKEAVEQFRLDVESETISDSSVFKAYLYAGKVTDCTDTYPEWALIVGPRGGIARVRA